MGVEILVWLFIAAVFVRGEYKCAIKRLLKHF